MSARPAMLEVITGLGDSGFLVPTSALLLAYFLYLRAGRAALVWVTTLALCAGLTILLKIGFHACGATIPYVNLRSPSGHASFSMTFYASFALMIAVDKPRAVRLALLASSAALVLAIAASRVLLHAHTTSEVAAGLGIGLCCVGWFERHYLAGTPVLVRWQPLLAAMLVLALLTYSWHLSIEALIEHAARIFRTSTNAC
jgi:membrane-associated phospholipid phosphatase